MPNGEIMCVGKSLGWVTDKNEIGKYLTIEKKGLSNEIIN